MSIARCIFVVAATFLCGGITVAEAGGVPTVQLDPLVVTAALPLQDAALSATQGYVTAGQLAQRPIERTGELLEFVPGMIVTQHSGEGKANQYFLRGFNLDHGTDFATTVDGMPVNMRTHAHGQGYSDLNFVIPELIGSLDYRKGPYYADVGDFSAAGSADLHYVDQLPRPIAKYSVGQDGYNRMLVAGSPRVAGGTLLLGLDGTLYQGPYVLGANEKKLAGIARFSHGNETDGYTLALEGYRNQWTSTDQIPQRAIADGQISRYGNIDPTDGGRTHRISADFDWRGSTRGGHWQVQGYALAYRLHLFSDFTYYLRDPVDGDQFEQFDNRRVYGLNARRYWLLPLPIPVDLEIGSQFRYDDILPVGLYDTKARAQLKTVSQDKVRELSEGIYLSSTQKWSHVFRSVVGMRVDAYRFLVDANLPANSGTRTATISSPKASLIFGPWDKTGYFINFGYGFHSNDARGVTLTVDPNDGVTPQAGVTPLVKARGIDLGVVSAIVPHTKLTLTLWQLELGSELVYSGDDGTSQPSGASHRRGVEVSAYYTPRPWLALDADYAASRARLESPVGNRIPNAVENVFSLGLSVPETRGWSGGLRVRHLGPAPLIEDNSARSKTTTVVNTQVGYRILKGLTAGVELINVFNSRDNDITYYYTSRLPGEPAAGVDDYHLHPVEPRMLRLSLTAEL
jgi:hypothetical protein